MQCNSDIESVHWDAKEKHAQEAGLAIKFGEDDARGETMEFRMKLEAICDG